MTRVRLSDIVDAIDMQFEELSSFLNLDTGEVEMVPHDLLRTAEKPDDDDDDDDDQPDLPDWQEEQRQVAKQIATSGRFIRLPTKFDVHEWAIMRDFCSTVDSERVRKELLNAIHGRGAFRMFKEIVRIVGSTKSGPASAMPS